MDQQRAFNPATGHPDIHAGEAGLPGPSGTPPATVLSEGEWLAVSTGGFSEQQRGRPLEHLVKELVQNAMDSVGGSGRIDLDIQPSDPRRATVRCADDGPGADDLSRLNVVFVTGKKDGVTQRGRIGRGFKELLSVATHATVRSRDQELCFSVGGDGVRRVTHRRGLHPHPGFEAIMEVEHDEAGRDLSGYLRSFLLPPGIVLAVNGVPVPPRPAHKTVEARLTTERFARGRWEKPVLATRVHLVATAEGEQPLIHEMGIPVCDAEWSEPFHVDVGQRVPIWRAGSWRMLHLGVDARTGRIVASTLTSKDVDDAFQAGPLLDQVAGAVASFTGDGGYDQDRVYNSVAQRHPDAAVVVPPRATAVPSDTAETAPTQRDGHLQHVAEHGRMAWQNASGYNKRARVEATMARWKQVIGDELRAHTDERRATEVAVAVHALNRMLELGRPSYIRVA